MPEVVQELSCYLTLTILYIEGCCAVHAGWSFINKDYVAED